MSIYLDHNATTPLDERVLEAMLPYLSSRFGNPSSTHTVGRQARAAVEQAREQVADLVHAHPSQVVFTSGGTEANNLAIKGYADSQETGAIAVSAIEHSSVLAPAASLGRRGWQPQEIPVDGNGTVSTEALRATLTARTRLVSVMLANNESGVIQDIAALASIAREQGAVFHTDAVQAAGRLPVDFSACGAQLMTVSAHKIYGPKGAGALIVDKSLDMTPLLHGGEQEKGRRAGTENVAALVGFGKAAELARQELVSRMETLGGLKACLEERLAQLPGVTIFAQAGPRVATTTFFATAGIDGEALLLNLDQAGFAVASGAACESGHQDPSHVLLAMGVERDLARSALRVSLGISNTQQQIDDFIEALTAIRQRLCGGSARLTA
ncbi:MAG: cysteine desulfurase [Gammaproteobacteria bacterium RBG_16_57_12]|nr:MAG: cysteine desulfurase [Gammaproteobacteria bacterium RBG_16_57_12]